MPNSTPFLDTKEEIKSLLISALPSGYLYKNNEGINQILDGFTPFFYDLSEEIRRIIEDIYYIVEENQFLDSFLAQYGLPNVIFPDVSTPVKAVVAIIGMKAANNLVSKEDYENFLLSLGLNIKLYHYQNELLEHTHYPYVYPKIYGGVAPKKKLTWLVYIESDIETITNYNGIGDAFDIDFVEFDDLAAYAKNVLDYLKPDYIIFQYIDSDTKALYGII